MTIGPQYMAPGQCQSWRTPLDLAEDVRSLWGGQISLDPCTGPENHLRAERFYTEKDNGLLYPWEDCTWCNPPYGSPIHWSKRAYGDSVRDWILKAQAEASFGHRIGLLLSVARTEQPYFQSLIREATCFQFLEGKLAHGSAGPLSGTPKGAMLASWIFWFNVPAGEVQAHLGHRGVVCESR